MATEGDARQQVEELIGLLPQWQLAVMRFNDAVAQHFGIAAVDLHCLFVLDRHGPTGPGVIAEQVGLTTGSASRMIQRLVEAALVSREPDPRDRRRVVVTLLPSSAERLHHVYDPVDDGLRAALRSFTREELVRVKDLAAAGTRVATQQQAELGGTASPSIRADS